MTYLGETVVVMLPAHEAERYNGDYPANNPIEAGTPRPGVVVQLNDNDTVNVVFYHDGPQVHYVQNVPVSVLNAASDGLDVPESAAQKEAPKNTGEEEKTTGPTVVARGFDQTRVGDGTVFEGPGDERPAVPGPADQSPEPGSVVSGVPVNSGWSTPTKHSAEEAPSNTDMWEAASKE